MRARLITFVLAGATALTGLSAPAIAAPAHAVAERTSTGSRASSRAATTNASPDDAARYAEREKRSAKAKDFNGGNTVLIISGSGLLVALIIILILV